MYKPYALIKWPRDFIFVGIEGSWGLIVMRDRFYGGFVWIWRKSGL